MAYSYEKCVADKENLYARDQFCDKDYIVDNYVMSDSNLNSRHLVHKNYLCTWIGKPK